MMVRTGLGLAVLSFVLSTGAAAQQPAVASAEAKDHLALWDFLAATLALGAIGGVADASCRNESFDVGPVFGPMAVFALPALLSGGIVDRHSPTVSTNPPPSATFEALKARTDWRTRVEVVTRDGKSTTGTLTEITGDAVVVQDRHGKQTIAQASIFEIDKYGDRSWDAPLISGGLGALYGFVWSCGKGTRTPRDRNASWGVAIGGVMGLALDLLHKGRTAMFRTGETTDAPVVRVTPVVSPSGGGVFISWRF